MANFSSSTVLAALERHSFTILFAIASMQTDGSSFALHHPELQHSYSLAVTLHTQCLPFLCEDSSCLIDKNSERAHMLHEVHLIIWDEAVIQHR